MNQAEIEKKLEEFRAIGRASFFSKPAQFVEPLDRGPMGTILHCPGCGERMAGIPHSLLVDEHFGCGGCGKVFYECDGRLWRCKFPEQDVPGWNGLKHDRKHLQKPVQGVLERPEEAERAK